MRDERLYGRPRWRVVYRNGKTNVSVTTLGGEEPGRSTMRIPATSQGPAVAGEIVTFADDRNGTLHVVSLELVVRVVQEQEDRYGDWHEINRWRS